LRGTRSSSGTSIKVRPAHLTSDAITSGGDSTARSNSTAVVVVFIDKQRALAEDHRRLDHVLQFANVARPVVRREQIDRPITDRCV
jgi:hypothetical protein